MPVLTTTRGDLIGGGSERSGQADDWEGFHRRIPEDQLSTGKDLSIQIEQDTSKIRHDLARFRRRAVSKLPDHGRSVPAASLPICVVPKKLGPPSPPIFLSIFELAAC